MNGYGRRIHDDNPGMEMMSMVNMFSGAMQRGQQIEQNRMALEDEKGVNAAYEHIAGSVGQTGDISALDGDPIMNTRYGTMAAGKFLGQRAQNETSRLQMLKSMSASDDTFYRDTFRPMAFAAQEAFQKGDMQRFGAIANELSQKSPMPYHVAQADDGNFTLMFRSNEKGGWVDTGQRMTPQEVMGSIGDIIGGEQKVMAGATMQTQVVNPRFLAAAARYRMGTIMSNAQAMEDPKHWIPLQKGSHTVWAIPQNRHDDYSAGPSYRIVDEGGKMNGVVGDLSQLMDSGYVRADAKAKLGELQKKAGAGGGGSGAGVQLNQSDRALLLKYATGEDSEGNKEIDYGKVAFLESFIGKTRLSPTSAIAAYEANVKAAMERNGGNRAQAEQVVIAKMAQKATGTSVGQKKKAGPAIATATAPQQQVSPAKPVQGVVEALGLPAPMVGPPEKPSNMKTIYDFLGDFNKGLKNYNPDIPNGY